MNGSRATYRRRSASQAGVGAGEVVLAGFMLIVAAACSDRTLDIFDSDVGLLAHWALDEAIPGSVVLDASGFGSSGQPSANPPMPVKDLPPVHFSNPYSLSFNGQDQWIEMRNPPILNIGGPTTFAAWIRAEAIDGTRNVVGHGYTYNPDHDLALRLKEGTYQFTVWDRTDHSVVADIPTGDVGSWVHLCGVYDASGNAYRLYRNGALLKSASPATLAPPANIDAIWAIGARAPQSSTAVDYQFQGGIDDVRIYGRALDPDEIAALYRR